MCDKLKPCPFCGKDVIEIDSCQGLEECGNFEACEKTAYLTIVCNVNKGGCGASSGYYKTKTEAIAAWNNRVPAKDQFPEVGKMVVK